MVVYGAYYLEIVAHSVGDHHTAWMYGIHPNKIEQPVLCHA
jgi:hypothetical protein